MKNLIKRYIKNEDGLVTIEWVGIAAVVVIAGIVITTFVMEGANTTGGKINAAAATVGNASEGLASAAVADLATFGTTQ